MIRLFHLVVLAGIAAAFLPAQTSGPAAGTSTGGNGTASYHHRLYHRTNTKKKTPPAGSIAAPQHADR